MRNITVTFADGTQHTYQNAPDDVTPDQVQSRAEKEFAKTVKSLDGGRKQEAPQEQKKNVSWGEVPLEALKNIPSSAGNMLGGIGQAVMHPINTGMSLLDAAAGGLHNAMPESIQKAVSSVDQNPENIQRAIKTADEIGRVYKDRYGSMEGFKNTLATDPVGVAGDLSTVLGLGAAIAPGKASAVLSKASNLTNPLSAVAPIAKAVGKVAEPIASNVLGLTTGVGAENIRTAARAGMEGTKSFMDNLSGKSNMTDVLEAAKQNVQNMGAQKSAQYRQNMAGVKSDKTVLNFKGIDQAVKDATDAVTYKGQVKNAKGAQVAQEIANEVKQWKALDPAEFHTPEGLDALKQKIGGIVESIPFEEKTARFAAGNVYSALKKEISAQAPTYANTMKEYSEATELIREIERALSLGKQASADTAMRKLQSLSRNNVSTNYGNRLDLAKTLEQAGGNDIMPAIAGQAMNSWVPRGLAGQAGGLANLGVAAVNPSALALLPLQSPRAVGSAAYGAGQLAKLVKSGANASPLTAEQAKLAALLASRVPQSRE